MSHEETTLFPGCHQPPRVFGEKGVPVAGAFLLSPKASLPLATRLLLKLKFGFHEGFYDANILSTTLKILPLKTVSMAQGPADCKLQGGKVPYISGKWQEGKQHKFLNQSWPWLMIRFQGSAPIWLAFMQWHKTYHSCLYWDQMGENINLRTRRQVRLGLANERGVFRNNVNLWTCLVKPQSEFVLHMPQPSTPFPNSPWPDSDLSPRSLCSLVWATQAFLQNLNLESEYTSCRWLLLCLLHLFVW